MRRNQAYAGFRVMADLTSALMEGYMRIAPELRSDEPKKKRCCVHNFGTDAGCQFTANENDLVEFDGRQWCYFHLPQRDSQGQTSPKTTWDAHTREAFNQSVYKLLDSAREENRRADFSGVVFSHGISFRDFNGDRPLPELSLTGAEFFAEVDFDTAVFGGHVDFHDSAFHGACSFHHCVFKGRADFRHASFYGDTWFKHAEFAAEANFSNTHFHTDAGFTESHFAAACLFNEAAFEHYAGFNNVSFFGECGFHQVMFRSFAGFVDAKFQSDADFASTIFTGNGAFSKAAFSKNATFSDTTFGRDARFDQTQFAGVTRFERAVFNRGGTFNLAKFNRDARFNGSVFQGDADFNRAKFGRDAGFSDVRFEQGLLCERTIFHGHAGFISADFRRANFNNAKFRSDALFFCSPNYAQQSAEDDDYDDELPPQVSFQGARFGARAMFANRKFVYPADFQQAEFTIAPDFYGCTIQKGTGFNGCVFLDRGAGNERAAWSYHTLKLLMEAVGDRANAGLFFTYEQEALSNTHQSWTILRALPKLYEITSGNGQSLTRPLAWLLGTSLVAFFVYLYLMFGLLATEVFTLPMESLLQLGKITGMPILAPFWAVSAACADCTRSVKVIMSFQSVLSLTWIGLFLWALGRNIRRAPLSTASAGETPFDEAGGA